MNRRGRNDCRAPKASAAALRLHHRGRLDLDAPVRRYVLSFPEKRWPVTSRELLGHLGGVRHYREDEDQVRYRSYGSVVEALEVFEDDSLLHRPGTEYEYSSYGYVLLSAAIAGASDAPFLRVMRRELFRPLDMRHTVADHPDSIVLRRAEFYRESDEDGRLLNAPFTSMTSAAGDTTGYAMGWRPRTDWRGRRVIRHGGSSVGGRAFLMLYPERELAVAILVNASRAPVFAEEGQTLAHLFLDHPPGATTIGTAGDSLAGTWRIRSQRDGETVTGTLHLTGHRARPGWMQWEGGAAPVPLVLVDPHGEEVRLAGAGVHGVLNLWLDVDGDALSGRWNWLGRTSEISGRRTGGGPPALPSPPGGGGPMFTAVPHPYATGSSPSRERAMGFGGSTAVVTGGNSGIGRAVARRLAAEGARVVIAARDRERGDETVEEISRDGGVATFVRVDVRDPGQVASLFEDAARDGGGVEHLFNNAGYEGPVAPLHELPADEVDRLVDTNLKGAIHVLREGMPRMSEGGCVVNNASFLGTVPFPGGPVYAASKAAVVNLTESVAETYGEAGVRAYALCPFNTDTPMIRRLAETGAVSLEQLAGMNPSGELGDPEEVASVVVGLMAGRREEPSGSALLVDRGPSIERVP